MKLIYQITVFPLVSTLSLYLILNIAGVLVIRRQHLKKGGAYFKVREIYVVKFQKFSFVFIINENEAQNIVKKIKKIKIKNKNIRISTTVSLFKCLCNHSI